MLANASDCCNCVKNTLACPTTTIMQSSCMTRGWCSGHRHACLTFLSFNYVTSHACRTYVLSRQVSQHSSSCRLTHHSCMQRTIGQWYLALCQHKAYEFRLPDWSKISKMTTNFNENLNQRLHDPLPFFGSILLVLWLCLWAGITECANLCCTLPY